MPDDQDVVIAQGLAAIATTMFEMGASAEDVRKRMLGEWQRFGEPSEVLRMAADEVAAGPQPLEESANETERARLIRERLGVQSAETQLLAAMDARAVLSQLADEVGS